MWPAGHPGLNQNEIIVLISPGRIQGRGPGGGAPPLYFWIKMSPKGQKTYFGDRLPPPYLRIWMTAPSLSPGLDQALYPTKLFKDPYYLSIVSLSKDVFERRTSTGSGLFSFLDSGFA